MTAPGALRPLSISAGEERLCSSRCRNAHQGATCRCTLPGRPRAMSSGSLAWGSAIPRSVWRAISRCCPGGDWSASPVQARPSTGWSARAPGTPCESTSTTIWRRDGAGAHRSLQYRRSGAWNARGRCRPSCGWRGRNGQTDRPRRALSRRCGRHSQAAIFEV